MRIFLVRHGESMQNIKQSDNIADHRVPLTDLGKWQAEKAAMALRNYLLDHNIYFSPGDTRVWVSPYMRTKQTCECFDKVLGFTDNCIEVLEDIALVEQQFAVFDSSWNVNRKESYPIETEYIKQLRKQSGKFWVRYPLGESPFDVACRVKNHIGTIYRDWEKHHIENVVLFTHGVTLRAYLMQYMHYTVDWYEKEHNPENCWIRYIEDITDAVDKGYIHKGED